MGKGFSKLVSGPAIPFSLVVSPPLRGVLPASVWVVDPTAGCAILQKRSEWRRPAPSLPMSAVLLFLSLGLRSQKFHKEIGRRLPRILFKCDMHSPFHKFMVVNYRPRDN